MAGVDGRQVMEVLITSACRDYAIINVACCFLFAADVLERCTLLLLAPVAGANPYPFLSKAVGSRFLVAAGLLCDVA